MTAHERFSKFVGEIGIPRIEYLYDLTLCDMMLIERGYDRRHRQMWSSTRWSTFYIMSAFQGGKQMAENGIYSPSDLLKFPWEKEKVVISEEEQKQLMQEIEAYNEMISKPQP